MRITELKNNLYKLVVETDDLSILKEVQDYFQTLKKASKEDLELDLLEEKKIQIEIKQVNKGLLAPNDEVRANHSV